MLPRLELIVDRRLLQDLKIISSSEKGQRQVSSKSLVDLAPPWRTPPPTGTKLFLISSSVLQNFAKSCVGALQGSAPPHEESLMYPWKSNILKSHLDLHVLDCCDYLIWGHTLKPSYCVHWKVRHRSIHHWLKNKITQWLIQIIPKLGAKQKLANFLFKKREVERR